MTSGNKIHLWAILFAACITVTGCMGSDGPDIGQVEGTITFEGKPLAGASVLFQPVSGRPAMGRTNEQGHYELMYIRDTKGCKTGLNTVVIETLVEGDNEQALEGGDADSKPKQIDKEMLPAKYNSKSELEVEVKPGKNVFDFDLTR